MRRLTSCLVLGENSLLPTASGSSVPSAWLRPPRVPATPPFYGCTALDYSHHFWRKCSSAMRDRSRGCSLPTRWLTRVEGPRTLALKSESKAGDMTGKECVGVLPKARPSTEHGRGKSDSPDACAITSMESTVLFPRFPLLLSVSPGSAANAVECTTHGTSIPSGIHRLPLCPHYSAICGPTPGTQADNEIAALCPFPRKRKLVGDVTCCSAQTQAVPRMASPGLARTWASPLTSLDPFGSRIALSLEGLFADGSRRGFSRRSWQTNKRLRSYKAKKRKRYIRRGETLLRVS
ncbi:conserved hypothetical protein [Neospora caninum Liverpool]|uniref:Uncharacterized protein n=1 Tax=Neospora caninum (strain Liverpool) TaxID=572307 RepID=F0VB98_NEOCL|nr:conserved hypothetical protein [Neospora caninum Liverpool]CBZ50882.1 conserved hypothetical protein [Neospora caninum Liverpool]CEL68184.1 TPA: hypothetical protein BN1204_039570 [Neospora caninum Liverpool]|eukprot:XP_003880915.1 conserved hypothetical protein [Neospora caninum Liverpool]